jgi:hypothetical protein
MPSAEGPAPAAHPEAPAAALLRRMLPAHAHLFDLRLVPLSPDAPHGHFRVATRARRVAVEGTSPVELASGAHWWLKHHAGCSVSWDATGGPQIDAAAFGAARMDELGGVGSDETVRRAVPSTFYQNVVTASYSFAFWDWDRCARQPQHCDTGRAGIDRRRTMQGQGKLRWQPTWCHSRPASCCPLEQAALAGHAAMWRHRPTRMRAFHARVPSACARNGPCNGNKPACCISP